MENKKRKEKKKEQTFDWKETLQCDVKKIELMSKNADSLTVTN